MPEQTYKPRVVRRGGGVRTTEDRGAEDTRVEKEVDREVDHHDRGYDQRRRYPRVVNPMNQRRDRGYRYGGPGRRYEHDQEHEAEAPMRRPRRLRPRTNSHTKAVDKHEVDSARECSGGETDDDQHVRRRNPKAAEPRDKEAKPKSPRKKLNAKAPTRLSRNRRQRLPKVYSAKEFLELQGPVEKLKKRLDHKTEVDEEEHDEAIRELVKYYEEAEGKNPYELALKMLMVAVGYDHAEKLFMPILRALDLVLRGEEVKDNCLTDELQQAAYVLSKVSEYSPCVDFLKDLFELNEVSTEKLKGLVKALLKFHMYRDALKEILDNELEKDFEMQQIIAPMLVQHIIQPLEDMFKKNPFYLESTIRYMDLVVGMSYEDMNAEVEKYNVPRVLGLGRQFLVRLILSWRDTYKFGLDWCPNIKNFFALQQLYYLNRRRFKTGDLSYINWFELTVDLVKANPDISKELVDELVRYSRPQEAKYWAENYKVEENQMAEPVVEALKAVTDAFDLEKAKGEPLKPKEGRVVMDFEIDESTIKFVDKEHECSEAFEILNEKPRVGVDVQLRPDTGLTRGIVSLLQVAHPEGVYVFDVIALKNTSVLVDGLRKLLDNPKVVKIGFNVAGDLKFLSTALDADFKVDGISHVVDLRVIQDKFYRGMADFLFPNANRGGDRELEGETYNSYEALPLRGLNSLVKAVYGKNLDRSEVSSNWDNRPLRQSQLRGAAVDALILIRLYDQLLEEAKKNEKDIEEIFQPIVRRRGARGQSRRSGGEDGAGTDSGEKTGDESGRSSRNEATARPVRYDYGYNRYGRNYVGRGRGVGGRFRGGYYGGSAAYAAKPRVPRDTSHPPATQAEEILEDGKVPEIMSSPKKPKDLKIVVDSMLRGLARALTDRGLDVVALRHKDRHTDCVDKSNSEKRIILTQGRVFYEMRDQVPTGYCFKVVTKTIDQQVDEVLKAYSVTADEDTKQGEDQDEVAASNVSLAAF
ncbi:unnamed protein product [Notodromas monacha]|uniref:3'-5' exonuclease domain-containing protein n=1 Tax=Notodromas monacha TaxID=399045 RepID=A0A7R9BPZ1_9CRUS|nr:unnamed protein product [Notodromas monacha]CAG0918012.1 unnamed protein product [Notodromas monacha]